MCIAGPTEVILAPALGKHAGMQPLAAWEKGLAGDSHC